MRRSSKAMLLACALVLLAGGALAAYARWVEPRWIETTHHQVVMHGPAAVRPIRIAHLSDLHTRGISDRERRVFRILAEEKPDVIVISGDTVTEGTTPEELRAVLLQLSAPLGVFAVRGNWEYWVRIPREKELYRQAGVRLLQNERVELAPGMWLVGLDDGFSGKPDPDKALAGMPAGDVCIALFHEPILFEGLVGRRCGVSLAGHTHGGQAKIPFLWKQRLPFGSLPYIEGWYEKDGFKLYVSRGIGTSILPIRFRSRPEVAIVSLVP